jgi:hypothetical protein
MSRFRLLALIGAFVLIPACQRAPAPAPANDSAARQNNAMRAEDDSMNMAAGAPDEGMMSPAPSSAPADSSGSSAPKERFISCPGDPRCRR